MHHPSPFGPSPRTRRPPTTSLSAILIVAKVLVMIGAWLVMFYVAFVGYMTAPAVMLFAFLVIYGLIDVVVRRGHGGNREDT